jgi:hypothetical protein
LEERPTSAVAAMGPGHVQAIEARFVAFFAVRESDETDRADELIGSGEKTECPRVRMPLESG